LPGIDVAGGLARVRNKVDFYRRMLVKFRDSHAAEIDHDLRLFIATGQRPEATRSAHSLKGIALSLGIERLGEMAAEVERSLKDPAVTADQALVAPLLAELDNIRQVLQTLG
jgi:HPt (histidine-containing phosphotransfer) domain-containing protein